MLLCFPRFDSDIVLVARTARPDSRASNRSRCRRLHLIICANSFAALCLLPGLDIKTHTSAEQTRVARVSRGNSNRQAQGTRRRQTATALCSREVVHRPSVQIRDENGIGMLVCSSFVAVCRTLECYIAGMGQEVLIEGKAIIKMFPLRRLTSPAPVDYEKLLGKHLHAARGVEESALSRAARAT